MLTNDNNRIGNNIRVLRRSAGYTQKQFANILNCSDSLISEYERGTKLVTREFAELIAEHFNITVDSLLNSEFKYNKLNLIPGSIKERIDFIKQEFPLLSTKEAMNNSDFKLAYDSFLTFYDYLERNEWPQDKVIDDIMEGFEKSSDDNVLEAYVNIIAFVFLLWIFYYPEADDNDPDLLKISLPKNKKPISYSVFKKAQDKLITENIKSRNEFKKVFADDLFEAFGSLNQSKFKDISDYYLALSYIYFLLDTDLTYAQSIEFGRDLMRSYARMKNKYAIQYIKRVRNRKTY